MEKKIKKNLSDQEMLANWQEKETFENVVQDDSNDKEQNNRKTAASNMAADFFTPELQEKVGKALLELKLNLYKQGIVDYKIKVGCEGDQIVLKPVPIKKKADRKS